jgi:hypothetical protein
MFTEHNALGIEICGCFKGQAEGPFAIGALLIIVLVLIARRGDDATRRVKVWSPVGESRRPKDQSHRLSPLLVLPQIS